MKRLGLIPAALSLLAACEGRVPTSATILPADTLILSGEAAQFSVEVRDQEDEVMPDPGGTWSALSGPVEVSATGLVTGTGPGVGTVRFTVEDVVADAPIRVNPELDLTAELSYLNQAIQNPEEPIPLVPGRAGLLRLFVAVPDEHYYLEAPAVRVEVGGFDTTITQGWPRIRKTVDESELQYSYNALIPGSLIEKPSVEVRVTYDPEDEINGISGEEVLTLEVADAERFDLMVVPTVSSAHPRPDISNWANDGLTWDHNKLWAVRKLLPVSTETGNLTVHEVLHVDYSITNGNGWVRWLNHMGTLRREEGRRDYYLGVMKPAGGGIGGIAYLRNPAVVAIDLPTTMSHELGHGMSLAHAPCNVQGDPNYPHDEGAIGQWGIDLDDMELIPPHFKDHMGYCQQDNWVSDFFFDKSLAHRVRSGRYEAGPEPVLVLSGDITGKTFEPALAFGAVPDPPDPDGTHVLTGIDFEGAEVFSFRFHPLEVMDLEPGHLTFNVAVPYDVDRDGRLARVTLTGPGAEMSLLPDSHPRLVMERRNGQIVSITTDHRGPVPPGALSSTGIPQSKND